MTESARTLMAGAARVKLEPPVGIAMLGYGHRVGHSIGVHDDLSAQALVLTDGRSKTAIVGVDLLAIGCRIADEIRDRVARATDIPADAIVIAATHTHSAPSFNIFATPRGDARDPRPERNLAWERALPEKIADAIVRANSQLQPARIRAAHARFTLGTNRRLPLPDGQVLLAPNYAGIADPYAYALGVYRPGGGALSFLVNYACHGVVLCEDNLLYSRDYPGFALEEIERLSSNGGPPPIGIFLNGATGNIDPRFRGSFEVAAQQGRHLGREIYRALDTAAELPTATIRTRRIPLKLKLKDVSGPLATARAFLAQAERSLAEHTSGPGYHLEKLSGFRQRALSTLSALEAQDEANRRDRRVDYDRGEMNTSITAIKIGDAAIVALPGEPFAELGMAIRANSPFPHTLIAGYSNDLIMYIPTREAYASGGYEVESARVAPGSGERMVAEAEEALRALAAEN
jgi:hypothetical protein